MDASRPIHSRWMLPPDLYIQDGGFQTYTFKMDASRPILQIGCFHQTYTFKMDASTRPIHSRWMLPDLYIQNGCFRKTHTFKMDASRPIYSRRMHRELIFFLNPPKFKIAALFILWFIKYIFVLLYLSLISVIYVCICNKVYKSCLQ